MPSPDTGEKLDFHPQAPALAQSPKAQIAAQSILGLQKSGTQASEHFKHIANNQN